MTEAIKDAIRITVDGEITPLFPADRNGEGEFTLKELQKEVGGLIELATCNEDGIIFVVNEEGLPLGLDYNPVASAMLMTYTGYATYLVGNVLVIRQDQLS